MKSCKKALALLLMTVLMTTLAAGCKSKDQNNSSSGISAGSYTHLDVYKRQSQWGPLAMETAPIKAFRPLREIPISVSYTHLDVYKRQGVYQ